MRSLHVLGSGIAGLALLACAGSPRPPVAANDDSSGQHWTGNLQPTQQRTGAVAVTGQNRVFGTVQLRTSEGALRRMHVALTVGVPTESSSSLRWAVLPDRCGTGELPLIGFDQFPLIDLGANGRGQLETDLPLEMAPNSTYHVNVYKGGQQLDNVITCGNLKFESAR